MKKITMYIEDNLPEDRIATHIPYHMKNDVKENTSDLISKVEKFIKSLDKEQSINKLRIVTVNSQVNLEIKTDKQTLSIPLGKKENNQQTLNYAFTW